jgi:Flp pilus assembly protein TadG
VRRRSRARRTRATAMLEFALILPLMLFMLAFCIDVGRMMYAQHAAQQALADAARQAAVTGAAGSSGNSSESVPGTRQLAIDTCEASPDSCKMALYALRTALSEVPGGRAVKSWTLRVSTDQALGFGTRCSAVTPSVKLDLAYRIDWLMPGMNALLSVGSERTEEAPADQPLATAAIARCEVEEAVQAPIGAP